MARPRRIAIVDGYTDEPAGFGVPPYIDVYPRYIAGAFWLVDKAARVLYITVDDFRKEPGRWLKLLRGYDAVFVVAGAVVPGRYLGGRPITLRELRDWFGGLEGPLKVLVGAAARWGIGNEGGSVAALPREVEAAFDVVVRGDPEAYAYRLASDGEERASPWERLWEREWSLLSRIAVLGARIVTQHPCHGYNLVAEIETYRGCSRWVSGGCSFCVTKLYGRPRQRAPRDIAAEVEALYAAGVRHFRLGRQADIVVYGSKELGQEEWPRPEPEQLRRLMHGVRLAAPGLATLHIDNVNPGTLVRHPEASAEALKVIIEYHTPGDVAAMGIETADPKVVKANNLKVMPEEALEAIRMVNRYGSRRGANGMPELLPGINFVLGLIGEDAETYRRNEEFLQRIYDEGLLVRRINVRKVVVLRGTRMEAVGLTYLRRNLSRARRFERRALEFSRLFLERVVPRGTILRGLYVEFYDERLGVTYARQPGSYPVVAEIPCRLGRGVVDVYVYSHSARSIRAVPVPLDANHASMSALRRVLGDSLARQLARGRPYKGLEDLPPGLHGLVTVGGYAC